MYNGIIMVQYLMVAIGLSLTKFGYAQTRFSSQSQPIRASANNDEYYIMLDGMSVFTCNGVENKLNIDRNNIKITDDYGNEAHYIKGPGKYNIEFNNIEVPTVLQNLAGEIGASLQVPVFEGPGGLRFDLPYQVIPEVGIINAKCDEQSGVVEHAGQRVQKYFCRYCDICATATDVSKTVDKDARKFIPELQTGEETSDEILEPLCGQIDAKTYKIKRRVNLPTKAELEAAGKKHFSSISEDVKQRLEKGTGRFHVFLNLITSDQPPHRADDFFTNNGPCQCFSSFYRNSLQCHIRGNFGTFLFRNAEQCKSDYVNQCLAGNVQTAACYSVEFNYKLAFDYEEVRQFLARKGLRDTLGVPRVTTTAASRTEEQIRDECVKSISGSKLHVQRYCKIFWNPKVCCKECDGIC